MAKRLALLPGLGLSEMRLDAVKCVKQNNYMMDSTTDDVAAALRLNKATVQRLLKTGRLKGY